MNLDSCITKLKTENENESDVSVHCPSIDERFDFGCQNN